jgi:hypothetical protein
MVAFMFSITTSVAHLRTIKVLHDERDVFIEEQRALGVQDLVVTRLEPRTTRSALYTLGDIYEDPAIWKNQAVANYYKLGSIWYEDVVYIP